MDYDPTSEVSAEIKSLISDLGSQGFLNQDMCKFALWSQSKPVRFYLFLKFNKPGVPGGPVISFCRSIAEKISVLVDRFLKPSIPSIPLYIKNTHDFLDKLRTLTRF